MEPFEIDYSETKNELLKKTRGICFEDVKEALIGGAVISDDPHPNKKKYGGQSILIVKIGEYVYAVPYVWDKIKNVAFLKTVYPTRKLTKKYLKK